MKPESHEEREIIDNENQKIENKINTFESWVEMNMENKEALLILNKIDKYNNTDIDLAFDKEKWYIFISQNNDISPFYSLKQLKILNKILEAYYNPDNNFNNKENIFKIKEEEVDVLVDGKMTDEWKNLIDDWREIKNWKVIKKSIDISNSDKRSIMADLFDDNLTVLTELWDSDLNKYLDFLNKFIKID